MLARRRFDVPLQYFEHGIELAVSDYELIHHLLVGLEHARIELSDQIPRGSRAGDFPGHGAVSPESSLVRRRSSGT